MNAAQFLINWLSSTGDQLFYSCFTTRDNCNKKEWGFNMDIWIYVHLRFNVFQKTVCHLLVSETLRGEFFIAILLSNFFFQLFDTFSLRHQQHHISRRKHCRKKEYLKKQNVPMHHNQCVLGYMIYDPGRSQERCADSVCVVIQ